MTREELIPGKLYQPEGYPGWYYIFLSVTASYIKADTFKDKRLWTPNHEISNSEFWTKAKEVSFSEVAHGPPALA